MSREEYHVSMYNAKHVMRSKNAIHSKHPFFKSERVTVNVFTDRIEFGIVTIDYVGKSYATMLNYKLKQSDDEARCLTVVGVDEYEGKYLIDPDEVTEDKLTIYFEDKVDPL